MSGNGPNKWLKREPEPNSESGTGGGSAKKFERDWTVQDPAQEKARNQQSSFEKQASRPPRPAWNIIEEVEKRPAKGTRLGAWYVAPCLIALCVLCAYRLFTDQQTIGTLKFVKDNKVAIGKSLAPRLAQYKLNGLAIQLYRSVYDANPKDTTPLLEVGLLEQGEGRNEEAVKDLQQVLSTSGPSARVYSGLGAAYGQLKQTDRALFYLNAALGLEPQSAQAWYGRAMIYKSSGNYDLALHDLEVPVARNYGPAFYRRVEIYKALHRDADAQRDETRIHNTFLQDKP